MTGWRPTPSLARAVIVAAVGLVAAAVAGAPELVVLAAPFLVPASLGLLGLPRSAPRVSARIDHHLLHEGQGTTSRLEVDDLTGVEQVTRAAARARFVVSDPADGAVGGLVAGPADLPTLAFGPRRWGRRSLADERVALTSGWAGFRWGPVHLPPNELVVLPQAAPYDSRAEAPQPVGLVGAHRSRRVGSGTEFSGIRPFVAGDRLRRISWPVSLRTGDLHVVTTRAEEDAAVLIVVDALRDIGDSGGIDGRASSLDLTVRAAAALADHHVRRGDRVGLRVVGPVLGRVPFGAGPRHLHRLTGTLARVQPDSHTLGEEALELGVTGGCVVYVLSPMLHAPVVNTIATMARRGLVVVAIDTLGERSVDALGGPQSVAGLAWRMRRLERDTMLERLAGLGCPVVAWHGPGTLDEVLHRLARRAQVPQVRTR